MVSDRVNTHNRGQWAAQGTLRAYVILADMASDDVIARAGGSPSRPERGFLAAKSPSLAALLRSVPPLLMLRAACLLPRCRGQATTAPDTPPASHVDTALGAPNVDRGEVRPASGREADETRRGIGIYLRGAGPNLTKLSAAATAEGATMPVQHEERLCLSICR